MHRLTGGRFTLGLGRGIGPMTAALGLPPRHHGPARGLRRADATAVARRDDHGPRRTGRDVPVPAPRPGLRRGHPARHHGVRTEHAEARRAGLRPGRAAHVLRRRDAGALHPHGQGVGRAGRAGPGDGRGLVVPGHDRRSPARARAPQEDGRADGHVPPGLRRPPRVDERLGPGAAGRVPGRPVRRRLPGRHRPDGDDRGARARRHADPAGVAGHGGRRLAGAVRRHDPGPVRPRRRRRHPPRRVAGRPRADRRPPGAPPTRDGRRPPRGRPARRAGDARRPGAERRRCSGT